MSPRLEGGGYGDYAYCEHCDVYTLPRCFSCGRNVGTAGSIADTDLDDAYGAKTRPKPADPPTATGVPNAGVGGKSRRKRSRFVTLGCLVGLTAICAWVGLSNTNFLTRKPLSSGSPDGALATFSGSQFSVDYPASWVVKDAEVPHEDENYTDTTIRRGNDGHYIIRVDVQQYQTPYDDSAEPVVQSLRNEAGYRLLSYRSTTFETKDGSRRPAVYWEFLLPHADTGVLMHNVDVFFEASGRGYALLTRAPESQWTTWSDAYDRIRASLKVP